jgi:hypothetical protein
MTAPFAHPVIAGLRRHACDSSLVQRPHPTSASDIDSLNRVVLGLFAS